MTQTTAADADSLRTKRFVMATTDSPVPHVAANTKYFEAGAIRIGVEYRYLNETILAAFYGAEKAADMVAGGLGRVDLAHDDMQDQGVSIHIFDAQTGNEHLRFDDLDDIKHYHYLRRDMSGGVVWYDNIANGEFLAWVFSTIESRLPEMLTLAGEPVLASCVDQSLVASAMSEVRQAVEAAKVGAAEKSSVSV